MVTDEKPTHQSKRKMKLSFSVISQSRRRRRRRELIRAESELVHYTPGKILPVQLLYTDVQFHS